MIRDLVTDILENGTTCVATDRLRLMISKSKNLIFSVTVRPCLFDEAVRPPELAATSMLNFLCGRIPGRGAGSSIKCPKDSDSFKPTIYCRTSYLSEFVTCPSDRGT